MGRLSIRRWPMVSVVELRAVSTSSACELTSTTSFPVATARVTGSSTSPPTVIETPVLKMPLKPAASTVTEYVPGGSCRTL